jgi:KaiC/GvpD/RAD55 family RecA-like ATPase
MVKNESPAKPDFDISSIKAAIEKKLQKGSIKPHEAQIMEQRSPVEHAVEESKHKTERAHDGEWSHIGVPGFDDLLEKGIPKGSSILLAGGPGSGKSIFGLQTLNFAASHGEKCLYMSFEESEDRLRHHMKDFGWDAKKLEKQGSLVIKRYSPYEITRSVEAMLEKAKGELMIDASPILFPEGFTPDRVVVDSLSAIASAFVGREETYRIYIEQLFRLLEQTGATSFLITESNEIPVKLTTSGVEEFLADGVIVVYNIKRGNVRESAIEVLKLRGAQHQKKIVAMQIVSGEGIVIYPDQEVFGSTE